MLPLLLLLLPAEFVILLPASHFSYLAHFECHLATATAMPKPQQGKQTISQATNALSYCSTSPLQHRQRQMSAAFGCGLSALLETDGNALSKLKAASSMTT